MIASLFMYASVANLVAMTIDRYIAIALPLRYVVLVTSRRALTAIFAAWALSIILAPIQYQVERADSKSLHRVFEITRLATVKVTPAVILVISTIRMLLIRRRHMNQAAIQVSQLLYNKRRGSPDCHFQLSRKRDLSSVQVICVVVSRVYYLLCYEHFVIVLHRSRNLLSFKRGPRSSRYFVDGELFNKPFCLCLSKK